MKVLFGMYPSNRWSFGGKERLVRDLARLLPQQGVDVGLLDPWRTSEHDSAEVFHLFGAELYQHEMVVRARARGMKVVVSAVLVHAHPRAVRQERLWRHVDRLVPLATSHRLRRDLLRAADVVVCMTDEEVELVTRLYGVPPDRVVRHFSPVSPDFRDGDPALFRARTGLETAVLCAGRIEPRKRVLDVLRALADTDLPVVLVGRDGDDDPRYVAAVHAAVAANPRAQHLGPLDPDDPLLHSCFAAARVHVMLSNSELIGTVNMEAAVAGARVVSTPLPSVLEAFGDRAVYADPDDLDDVRRKVRLAWDSPAPAGLADDLLARFGTPVLAQRCAELYRSLAA